MYQLLALFPPGMAAYLFPILGLLISAFTLWMLIDCVVSRNDTYWIFIILFTGGIGALAYFFLFKFDASNLGRGIVKRYHQQQAIRELTAKAYHLDNAHSHAKLGDVYLEQSKWADAQRCYETALERDPEHADARRRLGYALLAQGRAADAWPRLAASLADGKDSEYGKIWWESARCKAALGNREEAKALYEKLLAKYSYPRARVEFAQLLDALGETEAAAAVLKRVVADAPHTPAFMRRETRKWAAKARRMLAARHAKQG